MFPRGVKGLRLEIKTLKMVLENVASPIVFSHNDLLLTNIILQKDAENRPVNVQFIDYEYAMFNNQAFDIANHFIEFAGVYFTCWRAGYYVYVIEWGQRRSERVVWGVHSTPETVG